MGTSKPRSMKRCRPIPMTCCMADIAADFLFVFRVAAFFGCAWRPSLEMQRRMVFSTQQKGPITAQKGRHYQLHFLGVIITSVFHPFIFSHF